MFVSWGCTYAQQRALVTTRIQEHSVFNSAVFVSGSSVRGNLWLHRYSGRSDLHERFLPPPDLYASSPLNKQVPWLNYGFIESACPSYLDPIILLSGCSLTRIIILQRKAYGITVPSITARSTVHTPVMAEHGYTAAVWPILLKSWQPKTCTKPFIRWLLCISNRIQPHKWWKQWTRDRKKRPNWTQM